MAGWFARRDVLKDNPLNVMPTRFFQARMRADYGPFVRAHPRHFGGLRAAGKDAAVFEAREGLIGFEALLSWPGHTAEGSWHTAATLPKRAVIKLSLAEEKPDKAYAGAELSSRNEMAAMRRLTAFRSPYAPALVACCRYKLNRGFLAAPAYLVVLVMEFIDGESSRRLFPKTLNEKLPPVEEVLAVSMSVQAALKEMRMLGILHCDLHPDNVLLTARGVVIVDYGRCLLLDKESWDPPGDVFSGSDYIMDVFVQRLEKASGLKIPHVESDWEQTRILGALGINPDPFLWLGLQGLLNNRGVLEANGRNAARAGLVKAVKESSYRNGNPLPPPVKVRLAALRGPMP